MSEYYEPDPQEYLSLSDEELRVRRDQLYQEMIAVGMRWNVVIAIMADRDRVGHEKDSQGS